MISGIARIIPMDRLSVIWKTIIGASQPGMIHDLIDSGRCDITQFVIGDRATDIENSNSALAYRISA